jgi:UDP-N-acetylglucosamine 4,6-dehydratase/5-epimerase
MKFLITGGTGSLGKALTKRLLSSGHDVVIFSRDEGKQALTYKSSRTSTLHCVIGDIRDFDKLNVTFAQHKPDYVIHTAALKRIDDMEFHPDECIKTNIEGSDNVAKAALLNKVKKCILISTDKACQPVNVYGSSKFIAERTFTNYDYTSKDTIFSSVRYGNVIASRGSFIPLWISMIDSGQPLMVTSLDMTRFLFTLEDAVNTVLNSVEAAEGGEVFIPNIRSYDMRTILLTLEKHTNKEFSYGISGLRPGEKLHEDMLAKTELPYTFVVPGSVSLLAVRPQYTNRTHDDAWERYQGKEFNSSLHVSRDILDLQSLITRGLQETN